MVSCVWGMWRYLCGCVGLVVVDIRRQLFHEGIKYQIIMIITAMSLTLIWCQFVADILCLGILWVCVYGFGCCWCQETIISWGYQVLNYDYHRDAIESHWCQFVDGIFCLGYLRVFMGVCAYGYGCCIWCQRDNYFMGVLNIELSWLPQRCHWLSFGVSL